MGTPNFFNDSPISIPEEDRFGIDPFARALARSFNEISSPVGATIALNGPWGSGKSSAVNLIRHHLRSVTEEENLLIVDFKCWWFHGEEALTLAFLQTLNTALGKSLSEKAKDLIPKIGKTLLQAGPVIGPAINIATGSPFGTLFSRSLDFTKQFFPADESVEGLFRRLSEALEQQKKRFLVIIDDIDRLTPDEALLVFRLVKSVGRLPNVMYLIAFDRELAEKAVKERYPSEGPHFLEKIIQAYFELPLPARDDLNGAFLAEIERRCGAFTDQEEIRRFMNIFYDFIVPYLNSPRDLTRLTNSVAISWPPVAKEVNVADFVALEVIRVFEPKLYNMICSNKERVCGTRSSLRAGQGAKNEIEDFLNAVPAGRREQVKTGLMRLFPRFENVGYSSGFLERWVAQRLVCTEKHFETYFRMAIGDETLSVAEINEFVDRCGDGAYVKRVFREAFKSIRKNGKSKVPLLLDEVNAHASKIEKVNFEPLISAIFEIADEIDRDADRERGFSIGDNPLRIHWLIRKLTFERCDLDERSKIFTTACRGAQLGWLVDFTSSAITDYHPREGKERQPAEKCLVKEDCLDELRALALKAIKSAATNGGLIVHKSLPYILFRWREFAEDDGASVKAWISDRLVDDVSVAYLAKAFTRESWTQGMGGLGDRVAMRHTHAAVDGLQSIIDVDAFRRRLEELGSDETFSKPYKEHVNTFLEAWRKRQRGEED